MRCSVNDALRLDSAPQYEDPRPFMQQLRTAATSSSVEIGPSTRQRIIEGVVTALIVAFVLKAFKAF